MEAYMGEDRRKGELHKIRNAITGWSSLNLQSSKKRMLEKKPTNEKGVDG